MSNPEQSSQIQRAIPLSEATYLILVSLESGPKHGYAILREVEELSQGRVLLSTGTLYGAIKRLLADGWISRLDLPEDASDGRERKSYALTSKGRHVLQAEMHRLRQLVEIASQQVSPGGIND